MSACTSSGYREATQAPSIQAAATHPVEAQPREISVTIANCSASEASIPP